MRSTAWLTPILALALTLAITLPNVARAQYRGGHYNRTFGGDSTYHGGPFGGPGPIAPPTYPRPPAFPYHPAPIFRAPIYHHVEAPWGWRSGHWIHERRENRLGWWWVNALGWHFYAAPVYPYPPQTTIIYQSEPETEIRVTATPSVAVAEPPAPIEPPIPPVSVPGDQTPPTNGTYYFCESSQLYYPYARTCSEHWKVVPQAPVD